MVNRRVALGALLAAPHLWSGPRFRVYAKCLPAHLASTAERYYQQRVQTLAAIRSPNQVRARQRYVRETFWRIIGGEPARTPLEPQTHGSLEREGYRLEKLSYSSTPGVRIPANLYLPAQGRGPFPGVLFQMGHSLNGKAADPYQKCCQALARLGYVVLAFDPFGQGERTYYGVNDADEEHSRAGRQMLLVGDTMTRLQLWDAVRSLDVLAAHPQVDPKRLASTGQSGGGTLTMLLAAVDDRLACAAVSCGNTENFACARFNPPGSTDDAEQNLIGAGPLGIDRWDLLYPFAPKPLLVLASERDDFGTYSSNYLHSGEEEFARLREMYRVLGHADRIEWAATGLPHALSHPLRLRIYRFFERWLKGSARPVDEPPVRPEPEEALLVGVRPSRVAFPAVNPAPVTRPELMQLLKVPPVPSQPLTVMSDDPGEAGPIETIEIPSAHSIFLPGYLFRPRSSPKSIIVLLEPGGRTRRWREGELCHALCAAGHAVCALDISFIGDLWPELGRDNSFHARSHATEEAYAWAGLMLDHPLLGQRIADIRAAAAALRHHLGTEVPLKLAASASMCVPALCASALTPEFQVTYLSGGLISWRCLLDIDDYTEPFANFVPGILRHTDLPLIARLLAPRRLILAGPVNGKGQVWTGPHAYPAGVELRPRAAWTTEALSTI